MSDLAILHFGLSSSSVCSSLQLFIGLVFVFLLSFSTPFTSFFHNWGFQLALVDRYPKNIRSPYFKMNFAAVTDGAGGYGMVLMSSSFFSWLVVGSNRSVGSLPIAVFFSQQIQNKLKEQQQPFVNKKIDYFFYYEIKPQLR